jgi:hypothetical protein
MAGWLRGEDVTETLKRADAAMYRDKQQMKRSAAPAIERPAEATSGKDALAGARPPVRR